MLSMKIALASFGRLKQATPRDQTQKPGSYHKRQKAQAPTPQAPMCNRKTRKVANAKVHNRYTNLT